MFLPCSICFCNALFAVFVVYSHLQVISALESETVFSGASADVGQLAALSLCLEADAKPAANDAAADASAAAAAGMLSLYQ